MNLSQITSPEDLKGLGEQELEDLAKQIRIYLIETVSRQGGHLASNLGVVELTLALHVALNAPEDKIIWDVGHQSYVHKLITGRFERFDTLRSLGGISGFPKPSESPYDAFVAGHSSTSVSVALGMARARDYQGQHHKVVAVLGDGALTGGMAFEAINDAGDSQVPMVVVLNDNEMSISRNVGALANTLAKMRTRSGYTKIKKGIAGGLMGIPLIGKPMKNFVERAKQKIKYMLVPGVLFEQLGFTYLGPVDGHDIGALIPLIRQAVQMDRPVLLHVVTKKGKGFIQAEDDPQRYHGVAPFFIDPSIRQQAGLVSFTDVFAQTLCDIACRDERVVAISAAMVGGTGLDRLQKQVPERVLDVGIAEQHAVTMAAGLAAGGMRPVVALYSSFTQRAYDQIIHDMCLPKSPMLLCIDRAGLVGDDGETHQGVFDISMLLAVPHLTLLAPKDGSELAAMVRLGLAWNGPVAIRYPKDLTTPAQPLAEPIQIGRWERLREGADGELLAVGRMVDTALSAAKRLSARGLEVGVVNARCLKPMDEAMLADFRRRARPIVTLEDGVITGGFGSQVAQAVASACPCLNLGIPDAFVQQGRVECLFELLGLDAAQVADRAAAFIEQEGRHG